MPAMTEYYMEMLKEGKEYQDFAAIELLKVGISINLLTSEKYQKSHGESLAGIEIKHDRQIEKYGNIFFETHEKTKAENQFFVESGILRKDNTWIYAIGDYKVLYLLPKKRLQQLYRNQHERKTIESYQEKDIKNGTAKGFVLSADWVERTIAEKVLRFK